MGPMDPFEDAARPEAPAMEASWSKRYGTDADAVTVTPQGFIPGAFCFSETMERTTDDAGGEACASTRSRKPGPKRHRWVSPPKVFF
jgi:hypothetical protein